MGFPYIVWIILADYYATKRITQVIYWLPQNHSSRSFSSLIPSPAVVDLKFDQQGESLSLIKPAGEQS